MAQVSIPVDLFNPGQVFACMGFLEAADVLLGRSEGGFDWDDKTEARFQLRAAGTSNPVEAVLEFLIRAQLERLAPRGHADTLSTTNTERNQNKRKISKRGEANESVDDAPLRLVEAFPAPEGHDSALPLRLSKDGRALDITHFCDGSSRNSFKLFAGRQRSAAIARQMLEQVRKLWSDRKMELLQDPLGLTVPLGGSSFKFDARKAWTPIDVGYSPDEQSQVVEASPVVELLAAIGLEHARPDEFETRKVRYGVWKGPLPPVLGRAALGGAQVGVPLWIFTFTLAESGKNKNVTFAQEEVAV